MSAAVCNLQSRIVDKAKIRMIPALPGRKIEGEI